jgi:hypothetical protein
VWQLLLEEQIASLHPPMFNLGCDETNRVMEDVDKALDLQNVSSFPVDRPSGVEQLG